ncbi:MAG: hypothetical protein OXG56_03930 [Gammaproteobacteria bacterium]|nr:hypothetical protein [Gammaproteobacteria bacterium]
MTANTPQHNYTRNILLQMALVLALLAVVAIWQRGIIHQIYFANQVNTVGWAINGGIALLFVSGLAVLIRRFFEYRNQELSINRFIANITRNEDPLLGIDESDMVAKRFLTLKSLNRRRANINQSALAATLLASESSRNSFLKFVHNILILTGVFGTIVSLSIALLGASDILQGSGQVAPAAGGGQTEGLGTMIFGMSTALSTTLTAIIAYLFFGYFYIKLTDTQTFLVSKIEEVTATTLLPHLQLNQEVVIKDYSDSILAATALVENLTRSQKAYADSADSLRRAAQELTDQAGRVTDQHGKLEELLPRIHDMIEQQRDTSKHNAENMDEVVSLLRRGFRLRSDD